MQVAMIPADNDQQIRFEDITADLDTLQSTVGGDIELVGIRALSMNMFINENGKSEGLPANARATALCHRTRSIFADDHIAGDAVLLGPIDDEGDETALAEAQVSWLRRFGATFAADLNSQ